MADAPHPSDAQVPVARPIADYVPFARPVTIQEATGPQRPPDDFLLSTSTRREAWADIGALVVCLVLFELASVVGAVLSTCFEPSPHDVGSHIPNAEWQRAMLFPMLTLRAIFSIAVVELIIRRRGQSVRSVGLRQRGFMLDVSIGVAAAVTAFGLTYLVMSLLRLVLPDIPKQMEENAERIFEMLPRLHPLGFVALSIVIGTYEELVFRGFLMVRLRRALGSWTAAVLVSGLVFTGLHALDQVTAALIAVGILALVFSLTTIWRRSIVPAIVAHILWNLSQFLYFYSVAGDEWV